MRLPITTDRNHVRSRRTLAHPNTTGWQRSSGRRLAAFVAVLLLLSSIPLHAGILEEYTRRLDALRADRSVILRSAAVVAERRANHPEALLNVPYGEQPAFAEELLNRAGGLSEALPSVERRAMATPNDIVLFSVRSWETDGQHAVRNITDYRNRNWKVILFASSEGMPENLVVDYLIDNHAPDGSAIHGPANLMANVTAAWLWCLEYTAALTHHGYHPGILQSIMLPEATAHNRPLQNRRNRPKLHATETRIDADTLSPIFLDRVSTLVAHLASDAVRGQLQRAADPIHAQMQGDRPPILITCTHILMHEIFLDLQGTWRPINVVHRSATALANDVTNDDLIVWFGYVGMGTPLEDYYASIHKTGARLVACYLPDHVNPEHNSTTSVAILEQSWQLGDSVVPIPFAPGSMAPLSGIEQGLLFRMLDEHLATMQ